MRKLQRQAAENGVAQACAFFDMTPGEVLLVLVSHAREQHQQLLLLHAGAHLHALSFHAPRQLPTLPSYVPGNSMTPDEMKQRLLSWRRKE